MNITEILVPAQASAWLPWAVQYFFYIGSAYAAAILFLIALVFHGQTTHRLRAALVLTLAIGAIVGPLALTGDLHQPGRAWHFYTHLTPWSWMSLGSIFLPVFSGLAVGTAWLYLRNDLMRLKHNDNAILRRFAVLSLGHWPTSRRLMLSVAVLTVVSGLSIALYTGAEIAVVQARSLWHQPASPLLWFTTAFLGAIGFSLILWLLFTGREHRHALSATDIHLLKRSTTISAILAFILVPIWASNNASFSLFENHSWVVNLAIVSLSLLVCVLASRLILKDQYQPLGLVILALITLATCWVTRWVTMMDVQTIGKFDVGPYPYILPTGSSGLLGIVGMFGLWVALAMLASELVDSTEDTSVSTTLTHH
ncbi:NrfD/PsrC family molybdoenzyme membrane anchor subunit [Vibrio sp. 10N.261.51.F12]|uniref:NrfD/PsrC family molybdoenzyme membrane anchor subunit n=1 Tax=Vibrio sp. 10N.261.51.F12 TaxID=3229679 RepID=UPI003552369D